jgi:hypothetical protein
VNFFVGNPLISAAYFIGSELLCNVSTTFFLRDRVLSLLIDEGEDTPLLLEMKRTRRHRSFEIPHSELEDIESDVGLVTPRGVHDISVATWKNPQMTVIVHKISIEQLVIEEQQLVIEEQMECKTNFMGTFLSFSGHTAATLRRLDNNLDFLTICLRLIVSPSKACAFCRKLPHSFC